MAMSKFGQPISNCIVSSRRKSDLHLPVLGEKLLNLLNTP
ncbi:uncharacterized protein G2W53_012680 [Senna tora]|uniref:Uncharacterized protein n=1 Tax=Senna tora TaxID=362788 RepID=A0A834WPZ6_9FABA|nr:uncharacterized protein G2W53_012680 [Senna tora]